MASQLDAAKLRSCIVVPLHHYRRNPSPFRQGGANELVAERQDVVGSFVYWSDRVVQRVAVGNGIELASRGRCTASLSWGLSPGESRWQGASHPEPSRGATAPRPSQRGATAAPSSTPDALAGYREPEPWSEPIRQVDARPFSPRLAAALSEITTIFGVSPAARSTRPV